MSSQCILDLFRWLSWNAVVQQQLVLIICVFEYNTQINMFWSVHGIPFVWIRHFLTCLDQSATTQVTVLQTSFVISIYNWVVSLQMHTQWLIVIEYYVFNKHTCFNHHRPHVELHVRCCIWRSIYGNTLKAPTIKTHDMALYLKPMHGLCRYAYLKIFIEINMFWFVHGIPPLFGYGAFLHV